MFKPNKYQKVVNTYIEKGKGNAVIDAVAGSGKSTTIVNALKLIPSEKSVLFLAFNKAIVEELKIKIGNLNNVTVKTLHGLGASSLMKSLDSKLESEKYKLWLNNGFKMGSVIPQTQLLGEEIHDWKDNILTLIDLGRVYLAETEADMKVLVDKYDLLIVDNEISLALRAIKWGRMQTETIDFTDMIYLPNVLKIKLVQYDWVFIDECQDLNTAQRELFLKCLKPEGRFVAVGDPKQAIYGFAGADVNSFNILKSLPKTVKLPLSVCYRCDQEITLLAKELVPQIEYRDGADLGVIQREATIKEVVDGDMILCRLSAPLISLCMKYISDGVKAYVKGRDIGINLINLVKKTNKKNVDEVLKRLALELQRTKEKVINKQKCSESEAMKNSSVVLFEDKIKAIETLSQGLQTSKELIDRIESIFSDDQRNGICLSTIHKSKGLENNRVFILKPETLYFKPCMSIPWMAEQEKNLVYVAYTRAKHLLGFLKDF